LKDYIGAEGVHQLGSYGGDMMEARTRAVLDGGAGFKR